MAKSYFVALSEEIAKKGGKGYQKGAILLIVSSNGGNKKKCYLVVEMALNFLKEVSLF